MARLEFTQETADAICERVAGGESVRRICAEADQPAMSTVFKWLTEHREFAEQYARARELQAEGFAEEIVSIVDTEEDAARARVRMDARKWVASKLLPKKYGDKLQVDSTLTIRPAEEMTDDELAAIAAGSGSRAIEQAAGQRELRGLHEADGV